MPLPWFLMLIAGYFRQFLTRLIQNLTPHKNYDSLLLTHGTQQLSSQSNHWTIGLMLTSPKVFPFKGLFQSGEMRWLTMHFFCHGFPVLDLNSWPTILKSTALTNISRLHQQYSILKEIIFTSFTIMLIFKKVIL